MSSTLNEMLDYLKQLDKSEIIDLLQIDTEDLLDAFENRVKLFANDIEELMNVYYRNDEE